MFVIPYDRLPPGFATRLDAPPPEPAAPRPAATAVLLRDADGGPELLLLRRNERSGFVPGAYVFPGGRVDDADADDRLLGRCDGLDAGCEPRPAFWLAAVRELFEETGVLVAVGPDRHHLGDATALRDLARWREEILEDRATLLDLLQAEDARIPLAEAVYCGHWITPVVERRRYDARFFLLPLPEGQTATPDARETTDAVWLTPEDALERFRAGRLPMVFPTVRTIEGLVGFDTVGGVLAAYRDRPVARILPRLVRTAEGVGIVVD